MIMALNNCLRSAAAVGMTLAALSAIPTVCLAASPAPPTIVVIGGMKSGLPDAEHDWPDGALKLERLIKAAPEFTKLKANVKVFPIGFPKNLAEIGDASVIVMYFGTQRSGAGSMNPVQDPAVKQALDGLMARGVGLVALHQAFTIPEQNQNAPFKDWLGGVRIAVTDYTVENAPVAIATAGHPIASGVTAFEALDEFYPTIEFGDAKSKVTPILTARIHVQHRKTQAVWAEPAASRVVAWAYERPNGGRAFAYSGGHYLATFDHPQVRTTVLNAILWAARGEVPKAGVIANVPTLPQPGQPSQHAHTHRVVLPAAEVEMLPQPWGRLQWFVSRALGNSATMTVGQATIVPGQENPPHWHPNCDEVLHVVRGHIMHRVGDKEYEMRTGDTVVIPEGTVHNARNIGKEDAVLMVSFNSADRVAIGE
jgi:quercetin dioxygenase-like cupin family protein/type 1 glutamine amidotransferase